MGALDALGPIYAGRIWLRAWEPRVVEVRARPELQHQQAMGARHATTATDNVVD
jgi:hypothetical protein